MKKVSESRITITKRFLPKDGNTVGNLHGGALMRHMDFVAAIVALRHARGRIITAGVEHMSFAAAMKPGEILHCHSSVNCVRRASMEIGIRGEAEDPYSGAMRHVLTCYLHFMGVNDRGRSIPLPGLVPETDEDRRRMAEGARRLALSRLEFKKSPLRAVGCALSRMPARYALCRMPSWTDMAALLSSADAVGMPEDALLAVASGRQGLSVLLAEDHASLTAAKLTGAVTRKGLSCLRLHEPSGARAAAAVSELITLFAGNGIHAHVLSLGDTAALVLDEADLAAASRVLADSGHILADA